MRILGVCLMLGVAFSTSAAVFPVANLNDSGPGSLRQAIQDANQSPGSNTITFSTTGNLVLASALPAVNGSIAITGPGANTLTIDGANACRPLVFTAGNSNWLSGLTIANGAADAQSQGGAISSAANLTITDCVFTNNSAAGNYGGAICNSGTLSVENSLFINNIARAAYAPVTRGGAIYSTVGGLNVSNCVFIGNQAIGYQGTHFANGGDVFGGAVCVASGNCVLVPTCWPAGVVVWVPLVETRGEAECAY